MAALAAAVLGLSMTAPANANIQDKMDQIFGDMSNYTQPGAFNTQRRGVLNGGSLITRSRIVDTTLINIDLPHASGGCGGMDMFAGSISFINADQFIALLRAIAANAKGYAFQIAMNAASSLIASKLGEFQKVIQGLNSLSMNSCELAKGLVNTTFDAVGASEVRKTHGTEANLSGITDVAGSFWHSDNVKNPAMTVSKKAESDPALAKKLDSVIGNLVWKELKQRKTSKDNSYLSVNLYDKNGKKVRRYVHHLVFKAFNNNSLMDFNTIKIVHIDKNKENNRLNNLQIAWRKKTAYQDHRNYTYKSNMIASLTEY